MMIASHSHEFSQPTTISVEVERWQLTESLRMGRRETRPGFSDVQALQGLRGGTEKLGAEQH